jgi:hypothetical protein
MDFLDYNSEDDDGGQEEIQQPVKRDNQIAMQKNPPLPKQEVTALKPASQTSSAHSEQQKKKKTLDISFLPKEIQEGLLKGIEDSDDEDFKPQVKRISNTQKTGQPSIDPLLSMLPPPKKQLATPYSFESNKLPAHVEAKKTEVVKPTRTQEEEPEVSAYQKFLQQKQQSTSSKLSTTTTTSSSDPFKYNNKSNMNMLLNPSFTEDMGEEEDENEVNESRRQQHATASSSSSSSVPGQEDLSFHDWKTHKRKREREIEQSLMSGDTSIITEDNINIANVQSVGPQTWDAMGYANKQEREAHIISTYTNGGQMGTQPNRLQNKRHQLSSLALKAAQTEISLLDAKSTRTKSKAQTQAKYGW